MIERGMRLNGETADFMEVFEEKLSRHSSQRAAYEATEKIHERLTGHRKYVDFESFKVVRTRKLRKK